MMFYLISSSHTPIDSPCLYNARLHHTGIILFPSDAWSLLPCIFYRGFTLVVTLDVLKNNIQDNENMTLAYLRDLLVYVYQLNTTLIVKYVYTFSKYPSATNNDGCRVFILFFQNVHWLVIIIYSTINLLLENTGITFRVYLFPIGKQMLI